MNRLRKNNSPVDSLSDVHVCILINYLRRHHVLAFKAIEKRVGRLTILTSTAMEGDRNWTPQWDGLDVQVQKNFTLTLNRSSGFAEKNFVHLPYDTVGQLRRLRPDIVFSYEMGMRTLLSYCYKKTKPAVPLVLVGNMSRMLEVNRRYLRKTMRRYLASRVDYFTYNGPSCKEYLDDLGIAPGRQFFFPYCYDPSKVYSGEQSFSSDGVRRLLYCGNLTERKGILPFVEILAEFCRERPTERFRLEIAGYGPLSSTIEKLARENLQINLLGECGTDELIRCYRDSDFVVFPSHGDEWGLVPIEAWASGVPVIGSRLAQSVTTHCKNGENGWIIDPFERESIYYALGEASAMDSVRWSQMSLASRESVAGVSADVSADSFCRACESVLKLEPAFSQFPKKQNAVSSI